MHARAVVPRSAILLSLGVLSLTCAAWADDTPGSRATLKGLAAVKVRVALTSLDAQQDGLRSADLQADAEHRCAMTPARDGSSTPPVGRRHDSCHCLLRQRGTITLKSLSALSGSRRRSARTESRADVRLPVLP